MDILIIIFLIGVLILSVNHNHKVESFMHNELKDSLIAINELLEFLADNRESLPKEVRAKFEELEKTFEDMDK